MIRPLHDYCLIVRSKPETITSSGLHIPESAATSAANRGHLARVLATGPGRRTNDGLLLPMSVQADDMVVIGRYQNTTAEVDIANLDEETGEEVREWLMSLDVDPDSDILLMLRESEILALVAVQEQEQEADGELEDANGEYTVDAGQAFAGGPAAVCAAVGAVSMGGYPLRRRDELAEERASRHVREYGTPK